MARASFVLRKPADTNNNGSYLLYPTAAQGASVAYFPTQFTNQTAASISARSDEDSLLKADNLQIAPVLDVPIPTGNMLASASFFTADAIDYNQVRLTWGLTLSTVLSEIPAPREVIVVYSPNGEPTTVNDGSVLVQTTTNSEYLHIVEPGKWAYYTLFVKYESTSGVFYEPAAKLSVLVPRNYSSSEALYARIPAYYRNLDCMQCEGTSTEGGPLRRFLSVIGWDIDRYRTLLDYLITCKDPQIARSEELDKLSTDLGLDLSSEDIGAYRLRTLLNSIGDIRRYNGTPFGVGGAVVALTGSFSYLDVVNKRVLIEPQRVNYLKDPRIKFGVADSLDGGSPFTTASSVVDGSTYSVPGTEVLSGGEPSTDFGAQGTGSEYWQSYTKPGDPATSLLSMTSAYLRVIGADTYYFSVQPAGPASLVQGSIKKVTLYESTTVGGSVGTGDVIVSSTSPKEIGGLFYWELPVGTEYTSHTPAYLEVEYDNTATLPTDFGGMMLEKNNIGDYFDGDTIEGGWIVDANASISDYRWWDPLESEQVSTGTGFSIFSNNFQKTKAVISRLQASMLPVTELGDSGVFYSNRPVISTEFEVVYNYIPGYTPLIVTSEGDPAPTAEEEDEVFGTLLPSGFGGSGRP